MTKFKPGDIVVRYSKGKALGQPFQVHMYSAEGFALPDRNRTVISEPGVCDKHLNWFKASDVILVAFLNSRLYDCLNEED